MVKKIRELDEKVKQPEMAKKNKMRQIKANKFLDKMMKKENEKLEKKEEKLEKKEEKLEKKDGKLEKKDGKLEKKEGKLEKKDGKLEKKEGKLEKKKVELVEVISEKEEDHLAKNFHLHSSGKSSSSAKDLILEDFSIQAHQLVLFKDTSFKISFGSHVCLIGANGLGKTTLLKHIAERKLPISQDMDLLYVEQEIEASDQSVLDVVLGANQERLKLIKEARVLREKLEKLDESQETFDRYQEVQDELVAIQADRDESQVRKILVGLGFTIEEQMKPTKMFSGGWRMRISFARALYMAPTLLIFDEPTNHLDLNATIWLTEYLKNYKKSLLIVSHNQHFLNEVGTDIYHIRKQKLEHYTGNYNTFQKLLAQKLELERKNWEKVQKEVKRMQKKGATKDKVAEYVANSKVSKPEREYVVKIDFFPTLSLEDQVISVNDVGFYYEKEKDIFRSLNFGIDLKTRAVIVGPNGFGKTTLLNLLVGNLEPTSGTITRNDQLRVSYYNQHFVDFLPLDQTPIDYINSISILTEDDYTRNGQISDFKANQVQLIRKYLGTIGLSSNQHTIPIGSLSGGQKARVALVSLYVQKPHVIFLDEPTNHLDIESINGLIESINNYDGGVIMVSHDLDLITKTNAELWVCENYNIIPYHGDYQDYIDEIIQKLDE